MHSLLDATSITILLPVLMFLALISVAYKRRLQRLGIQSFEPLTSIEPPLQIYDPPLSESEAKFVTSNHTIELHGKWLSLTWLCSAVANGVTTVWLGFSPNDPAAIIWFISGLLTLGILPIACVITMKACDCGAIRVLSPKARLSQLWVNRSYATFSLKRELKSLAILFPLCAMVLAIFIGSCLLFAQLYSLIFPGARVAIAAAITVPTIILASLGIAAFFVDTSKRFITKAELERIANMRGETTEELNELIAFYGRVGNFKKTDEYSKKLLENS